MNRRSASPEVFFPSAFWPHCAVRGGRPRTIPVRSFPPRVTPTVAWRGVDPCGSDCLAAPWLSASPSSAAARASHSPDDFFTPVSRTRHRLIAALPERLALSFRRRSWDWIPSQVFSGCPGCDRVSTIARPHAVFTADQSRALAFGFMSREHSLPQERFRVWRRAASGVWPRQPAVPCQSPAPL